MGAVAVFFLVDLTYIVARVLEASPFPAKGVDVTLGSVLLLCSGGVLAVATLS